MNDASVIRGLEKEYEQKNRRALYLRDERVRELFEKYPSLARIDDLRREAVLNKFRFKRAQNTSEEAEQDKKIALLDKQFEQELNKLNIDKSELEPHYQCPKCQDTGFISPNEHCPCFKQKLLEMLYGQATLEQGAKLSTFEQFRPEIFPDTPPESSQRRAMLKLKEIMQRYSEAFPDNPAPNIILTGETGTGKTFMLSCVAARVLERGYTVLALTSARLIELLKKNLYSEGADMERLYSVDLLLIDELGMEPMLNNVTIESLFAVINERLRRRKAVLITTNLTPSDIKARYTERIASRLLDKGSSQVYRLSGIDLRTVQF